MPVFAVNNMKGEDCCCNIQKEEPKEMSCCDMQTTEKTADNCTTPILEKYNNVFDCGCFHEYNPAKQTIQVVKTNDVPKVKVIGELSDEWNLQSVINNIANKQNIQFKESPPIYLIDSSFLI